LRKKFRKIQAKSYNVTKWREFGVIEIPNSLFFTRKPLSHECVKTFLKIKNNKSESGKHTLKKVVPPIIVIQFCISIVYAISMDLQKSITGVLYHGIS
jgi:hypothetical protein